VLQPQQQMLRDVPLYVRSEPPFHREPRIGEVDLVADMQLHLHSQAPARTELAKYGNAVAVEALAVPDARGGSDVDARERLHRALERHERVRRAVEQGTTHRIGRIAVRAELNLLPTVVARGAIPDARGFVLPLLVADA